MAKFNVLFVNDEDGREVKFATGRSSVWQALDAADRRQLSPSIKEAVSNWLWGYYAAKGAGRLAELGVDPSLNDLDATYFLADNWSLLITEADKGEKAPLAGSPQE